MKKQRIITSIFISILALFVNLTVVFASIITNPPSSPIFQSDRFQTNLFTGTSEYSYPIKVPQGTNNLTPEVSVSYDSSATHGLVSKFGTGWELNQDYIQRDVNYTPSETSDDKYKLHFNGQTYDLVYNSTDSLFHTKIESHLKIQQFLSGGQGTTGMYWQVTTTDGTVYRFGYSSNAEVVCNGQTYDGYWNVDQVTDTYNNHIYYSYTTSNGVAYLNTIKYNNDQQREIDFTYVTNSYQRQLYVQGCLLTEASKLSTILVKANTNLVHEYDLNYSTASNSQPLLQSITEKGNNGSSLPPTTFDYKSEVNTWPTSYGVWARSAFDANFYDPNVSILDVNGDGLPDILKATNSSGGNDSFKVFKNTGGAFYSIAETWINNVNMDALPSKYWTRIIDITGDGLPDIVKATADTWYVWRNTGTSWNSTPETWASGSTVPGFTQTSNHIGLVDVNGDGLPDVINTIIEGGPYTTIKVYKNTGSSFNTTPETWVYNANMDVRFDESNVTLMDVNGDGLADWVKSFLGPSGGPNNEWDVWLNTGHSWNTTPQVWDNPIDANLNSPETALIDVNGDGLPDIVRSVNTSGGNNEWRVFLNNGSSWSSSYTDWVTSIDTNIDNQSESRMADVNGDGLTDLLRVVNINDPVTNEYRVWTNNGYAPDLLATVHNSSGGSTSFEYTPSTHNSNVGNDSLPDLPFPMWTVTKMTVDNGMTNSQHTSDVTTYSYKNGLYNSQAKEFRGFGEVDETDPNGALKQSFFDQDDALKGMLYKQVITDSVANPYAETDDTWNSALSNGIYTNTLTSEKKYTFDGSASNPKIAQTDYQYDQYGNVIKLSELGDTNVTGDERFTHKQYTYNTSLWILDNSYDTYVNGSDDTTKLSETWDYYDNNVNLTDSPTKGDVTKEVKWLSGGTNPTTTYSYDSYGNKTQETDANSHSTSWSYGTTETTHTYPDSTTNAKSQTTSMTYDLGTGNVISKTDPNSFTTSYTYDLFGRVLKEIEQYDSSSFPTKNYTYYDNTTAPQGTLVSQRKVSGQAGTLDAYTFVDGLGRTVQTRTPAEDTSKQIVTDTYYDATGKVSKTSVPHLDTLTSSYVNPLGGIENIINTYDPIARVTQVTNPQGTVSTTAYDHWKQTQTDENGHQKKQYYNAFNKIAQIDELNNGQTYTTSYTYDPLDNLTKIVDANNNNFTFTFDTLGRKTAEADPDMGTWHYTYDGVDNLLTKTDNRGKTTTKTYDQLNRIASMSYTSDPSVSYNYDGNSKIGTLTSVTDAAGTVSYLYDNRLRKTQEQRVTDGITWTTSYTYDAANRVLTTTKPDNEVVTNTYNSQGEVASVSGVVNNVDYNALNKVTSKTFNNAQTTNYTYNTNDFRLNRIQTGSVQDIGYTYDNVGNVKTTVDNLLSKTQTYGYDNLDRLTVASESAGYNYNYTYDPIGNLTAFSSPDTQTNYTYGSSTLVHAVASATSTTMIYDDSLAYGWTDASFNATNSTTTSNVYSGTNALSSVIGANGGLDFQAPRNVTTGGYSFVHFALKASQAGQQYKVYADTTFGQALTTPVSLASYGGQPTTSGWTVYNIPLADLAATNVTLGDIVIQNATGSNQPAVYVDQVELLSGSVPTPTATPTPTSGPTATPTPTPVVPALVQKNKGNGGGTGSVATSFTSNLTSGHAIVVMTVTSSATNLDTTSVTDNHSNTYTQIGSTQHTAGNSYLRLWYAKNVTGGSVTVTAHQSGSASGCLMEILDYSGLSTTSPADQSAGTTGTSTSPSGGSITPSTNNTVVISAFSDDNNDNVSITGTSGYTVEESDVINSTSSRNGIEDKILTTAVATTGVWTTGSSSNWAAVIVSLKP